MVRDDTARTQVGQWTHVTAWPFALDGDDGGGGRQAPLLPSGTLTFSVFTPRFLTKAKVVVSKAPIFVLSFDSIPRTFYY